MEEFLFDNSWFDKKYRQKSSARYPTFKAALNLIHQGRAKSNEELIIVETGTTRLPDDWGAGMSTVLFADYLKHYGGKLYTVDIEAKNIETCKEVTKQYSDVIEYVVADSHKFLLDFHENIDLLYLDSLDYPLKPEDGTVEECQQHQLREFQLARTKLTPNWSVVLLDDNDFKDGGKCRLTKQELLKELFIHVMDGQQSLWLNL